MTGAPSDRSDGGSGGGAGGGTAGRHVVLYDGNCAFCTRWRDRMARRDRGGRIEWLSVHDPVIGDRFADLDRDEALRQLHVFAPDGSVHRGADGWIEMSRVLDGMAFLRVIGRVAGARPLLRWIYRIIAARRDRLSHAAGGGLRAIGFPAAFLAAGVALCALACGEVQPDPVADRLRESAGPETAAVILAMIGAYGGHDEFALRRNVEYTYRLEFYGGQREPQKITRQVHRFGLGAQERAYIEDLEGDEKQIVRIDGDSVQVTRAGVVLGDPAEIDFPRAFGQYARWSFLIPWNLLDADRQVEYRGVRTPPAAGAVLPEACDVVRLRLGGAQGESSDWYDFYISRLSHLVERIHAYRAEDAAYTVAVWTDHRKFGRLKVATRRTTYLSDPFGSVGPLQLIAEYSDIRFDAPFGEDLFLPEIPLAASSGRQ